MKWQEVIVASDIGLAESLSDFLIDLSGRGISLEDLSSPGSQAGSPRQRIKAYLADDEAYENKVASLHKYIEELKMIFPDSGPISVTSKPLAEADWAHNWKRFFKPLRLTEKIVIKPSWEKFTGKSEDIILEIDPEMAFGTGSHPSTYLSLRALENIITSDGFRRKFPKVKVLDVGTGTGILGMAAAKLGAYQVTGIDIDREAVQIAAKNVRQNALGDKMVVSNKDLAEIGENFHLILANIMYLELARICPLLFRRLEDGGILILSGILLDQVKDLLDIYQKHGFSPLSVSQDQEWVCVELTKVNDKI